MSLRPLRVVNEDFSYIRPLPKWTPSQPLWKRRPEAQSYQPKSSGPPSWVEEQRAARAFWRIQLFYDMINASDESRLSWPDGTIAKLKESKVERLGYFIGELQEIQTAMEYLQFPSDGRFKPMESSVLELPWPSREVDVSWTASQPIFDDQRDDKWGEGINWLVWGGPAVHFAKGMLSKYVFSPVRGVTFDPYRRFGFAFWDFRRLFGLGLEEDREKRGFLLSHDDGGGIYYSWRSILSEEELAKIDLRQEERMHRVRNGDSNR